MITFDNKSIFNLLPFVSYKKLGFLGVDGESYKGFIFKGKTKKSIELTPGRHTLTLNCFGVWHRMFYTHDHFNYQIDVKSGHIYQMVPKFVLYGCDVSHKEVTSKYSGVPPKEP